MGALYLRPKPGSNRVMHGGAVWDRALLRAGLFRARRKHVRVGSDEASLPHTSLNRPARSKTLRGTVEVVVLFDRGWRSPVRQLAHSPAERATPPTDHHIQGPGLPGLCPGAYEAGMPHPSPHGRARGVARTQAGQPRTVAMNQSENETGNKRTPIPQPRPRNFLF